MVGNLFSRIRIRRVGRRRIGGLAFDCIRRGARIGAECIVGRDAFVDEGVTVGDRTKIQNAALIYHGVTVEDAVFIGPNAILTNDRFPRAITSTGDLARAEDWEVTPTILRHGCSIGAGASRR